jgi:ectoine hydroxylase-related dioxygenase (phytanoyl-CoA dioxygenase family)
MPNAMYNAGKLVSDADVQVFQEKGAVVLCGVFRDWVEPLRAGIEANLADPSPFERTYRPDDGSAPFFQDFCNWRRIGEFRDFVLASPAAALAARLMGARTSRIFHDHVLVKEPGNSVVTPWHHDQPYYLVEGRQSVSFWVPLDPIAREIAIEYVAGSHLWPGSFRPQRFDGTSLYEGDTSAAVPDVDARRDEFEILGWEMEPGDAVAFTFRTLHGAPANRSANRRRVISVRWVGDDAVFARRPGRTSPPFPDLEFEDGAPFDAPEFPVVFGAGP